MSRVLAPIVLFAYKREDHVRQTLEALSKNELANQSHLIIISDAGKFEKDQADVQKVRDLAVSRKWCGEVTLICNEKNLGLNDNFFYHISNIVEKYGRIIVLEEDLCTSPYFLNFMNDALDMYEEEKSAMQICGFTFDMSTANLPSSFFLSVTNGWGWATWHDRWQKLNTDSQDLFNKINSKSLYNRLTVDGSYPDFYNQMKSNVDGVHNHWDIKWLATVVVNEGLCLYPKESLVVNIGFDGSGTHFKDGEKGHDTKLGVGKIELVKQKVLELPEARKSLVKYFSAQQPSGFSKLRILLSAVKSKYFTK